MVNIKWLAVLIPLLMISCSSIRESSNTIIETKIDTIFVVNPEWEDSVAAYWENEFTVSGTFIDSLTHDTLLVVKYLPGKEIFKVKKYIDTVYTTRVDTVRVTNTTTIIKEPTFLEQWWWLLLIGGIIVFVIIIKLR